MFPIKLMTLFLLILLMLSSVLPAIKIHSWSGSVTQAALVKAQRGEIMLAVHRMLESRLTTKAMLENSPISAEPVVFDPQSKEIKVKANEEDFKKFPTYRSFCIEFQPNHPCTTQQTQILPTIHL